jgi:PAS domain S-box-containing protein
MPGLPAAELAALSADMARAIGSRKPAEDNFAVSVAGGQYLLFYKILNPGSRFPAAYEVCLYSLAALQAQQRVLQWKIAGVALALLVFGLAASNFFSARLSKPVEQLAEDSAQNLALRELAESELELTEQKYRSIFENAVEGIFLLAPGGKYLSANPAMARIFGCDSPAQFVSSFDDPARNLYAATGIHEEFLRLAETNGFVSNFETQMRRRDGTKIWVSQNARAVRDSSGALLHFEGTLEDITERKSAADSLRELNTELQKALADLKATQQQVIQQERLRALGQMASGIAHDFNNALMPVSGFAELLLLNPAILDDKKKAAGYLEIIRTASEDAGCIVARLREFYRSNENSDVFTQVDLKRLVRQTISLTQPKWKTQAQASGAEIRISEMLGDVPPIAGDESALREVFTNLIFNAVDAMPGGGTLTLRTFSADGRVTAEVSDTGAGMSDEVRARCMEPFFSTKGERGTGLGLAMVFGIVQRHDGNIDLRTKPGAGTTFAITFPVREAAPKTKTSGPSPQTQPLRVLVVDDEPQVRQVLSALLTSEGHEVLTAKDGVEGLRCFLNSKFDLVITDKAMPGMSGEQMAVAIRQFSSKMPIVLLTGFHTSRESAELSGISVIATKPITMTALRATIEKAMRAA